MKTYSTPNLKVFGTVEDLTLQPNPPIQPPGKLETGEDAFGQRSRIESIDGPASNPR